MRNVQTPEKWCAVLRYALFLCLQEASAARARLVCLRSRLSELRGLNADRQQRATELQERVAETEVGSPAEACGT